MGVSSLQLIIIISMTASYFDVMIGIAAVSMLKGPSIKM